MVDGEAQRYPVLPIFLVALFLILAAPVYWRTLEQPTAKRKERAYENVQLYQRVYPMMHYGFGRLRDGELPLWNPRQLCGTPFLANPQSGLFQPLNWVFLLPNTGYAMAAHAFLALALMAFGFVLFARSIGTGFTGALIGGMSFTFSGAVAAAISRPELAGTLAWAPFFFWALRECAVDWRLAWACVAGIFAALTLLAGSLGLAMVMLGLGLAYGAVRLVPGVAALRMSRRARAGRLAVVVLVGVLLSLVQWLPSLEWALALDKPWQVLWQIDIAGLVPHSVGELFAQMLTAPRGQLPAVGYLGIVAVAVLPAAFFARRSQVDAVFFTLAAILLYLLALAGDVPRETAFAPVLFLFPAVFSIAVLTALGADRLLTTGRDPRSPLVWVPAVLSLAVGVILFWAVPAPVKGILIVLGLVLLPFLLIRAQWLSFLSGAAVILIVFVDLSAAARNEYLHPFEDSPECYRTHEKALVFAEEQALGGRLLLSAQPLDAGLSPNLGMIYPIRFAGGAFLPLTTGQAAWWARLAGAPANAQEEAMARLSPAVLQPTLLNYMGVRVLLKGPGSPLSGSLWPTEGEARFRMTRQIDSVDVYLNSAALPRVYWTPDWEAAPTLDAALDRLTMPDFDGTLSTLVTASGSAADAVLATVPDRAVAHEAVDWEAVNTVIERETPELLLLRSEADRPGLVVLADTNAPGWTATVDGVPAPILRANGLFRAIAVPAGNHVIEMRYRPWSVYLGAGLSGGGVVLLVLLGLAALLRRRPDPDESLLPARDMMAR